MGGATLLEDRFGGFSLNGRELRYVAIGGSVCRCFGHFLCWGVCELLGVKCENVGGIGCQVAIGAR